ncbi:toprim domain-containing protein [Brockia lithotrophica]|uniref:Toprim domain protein n=1 Tax=Brockia lithotrophica TaxID=933949 RepID=A0A660L4D3_9BACL|nr:toprim domain-containing protein [Brockia lithotrophica]RKQ88807.1 toprim domain protein [Brockia lithotrophica]
MQKVIIVEGKTDQRRLEEVLAEPVTFLLTHGTLGEEELLRRLLPYEREDVYIFVDADEPGNRLRRLLGRWFPRAKHLYTRKIYREIAHTPLAYLARVLDEAHFAVREEWLLAWERKVNGKERGRRRRRGRNRHFDEEEGSEGRGT